MKTKPLAKPLLGAFAASVLLLSTPTLQAVVTIPYTSKTTVSNQDGTVFGASSGEVDSNGAQATAGVEGFNLHSKSEIYRLNTGSMPQDSSEDSRFASSSSEFTQLFDVVSAGTVIFKF